MEIGIEEYERAAADLGPAIASLTEDGAKAVLRNLVTSIAAHPDEHTARAAVHQIRVHAGLPVPVLRRARGTFPDYCSREDAIVTDETCLECFVSPFHGNLRAEVGNRRMACVAVHLARRQDAEGVAAV